MANDEAEAPPEPPRRRRGRPRSRADEQLSIPVPYSSHLSEFLRVHRTGNVPPWGLDLAGQISVLRHELRDFVAAQQLEHEWVFGYLDVDGKRTGGWLLELERKIEAIGADMRRRIQLRTAFAIAASAAAVGGLATFVAEIIAHKP